MLNVCRFVVGCGLVVCLAGVAGAQPTLFVSVATPEPGQQVTLTVTGTPGHAYAFIGSTVGGGFTHAGTPLAVGPDVVIIATGILPGNGTTSVNFTPPFLHTTIDRYYVQAATSPTRPTTRYRRPTDGFSATPTRPGHVFSGAAVRPPETWPSGSVPTTLSPRPLSPCMRTRCAW